LLTDEKMTRDKRKIWRKTQGFCFIDISKENYIQQKKYEKRIKEKEK